VASFHILTEPVPHTFVSVNRRNNEVRGRENSPHNIGGYTEIFYSVSSNRCCAIHIDLTDYYGTFQSTCCAVSIVLRRMHDSLYFFAVINDSARPPAACMDACQSFIKALNRVFLSVLRRQVRPVHCMDSLSVRAL